MNHGKSERTMPSVSHRKTGPIGDEVSFCNAQDTDDKSINTGCQMGAKVDFHCALCPYDADNIGCVLLETQFYFRMKAMNVYLCYFILWINFLLLSFRFIVTVVGCF